MNKKHEKHELYLTFLSHLHTDKQPPAPVKKTTPSRKPLAAQAQQFLYNLAAKAKRAAFA